MLKAAKEEVGKSAAKAAVKASGKRRQSGLQWERRARRKVVEGTRNDDSAANASTLT